jgi:DNA-binding PadR family transcriptional regulator
MGRHRHHRAFGPFGPDFPFEGGPGGRHFHRGRKLGSEDLQLVILSLLADNPSHGYELIKTLEERSGGFYRPSPGMVYPALTYLEEGGYATIEREGAKKRYRISEAARQYLEENRETLETILDGLARAGEKMEHLRRFAREEDSESVFGGMRGFAELNAARHELKAAVKTTLRATLRRSRESAPEEFHRIVEILKRAADEIRGG